MNSRRTTRWSIVVATLIVSAASASALASESETLPAQALFDGHHIDMSSGWEGAAACMVWPEATDRPECFATEAEMDQRIAELERKLSRAEAKTRQALGATTTRSTNCSSYLRLYDGWSYTGAVLYLRGRHLWFNLADSGFNQRTSSFKIGACSAYFADFRGGGGDWYPTSRTQAYDVATSMIRGWNNDVSSIYIT